MRSLEELTNTNAPAIELIRQWARDQASDCEILPPSDARDRILLTLQVSTQSALGALAYDTGGILVDRGWLRLLGSGHPRLSRNLADWNTELRHDYFLVADDLVGGFFGVAIEALKHTQDEPSDVVYYWAPDSLKWESIGLGLTDFLQWSLSPYVADFYQHLRWKAWQQNAAELSGDHCFTFDPGLWTKGASVTTCEKRMMLVAEALQDKVDCARRANES